MALLYGQLSGATSLREIETGLARPARKLRQHPRQGQQVGKGLAGRLPGPATACHTGGMLKRLVRRGLQRLGWDLRRIERFANPTLSDFLERSRSTW